MKLRAQLQFIICTPDRTLAFVNLNKKSHSYIQFPNCGMDFLWNKRHLLRSSFYCANSTGISLAFPKTSTHFSIYCIHKFVPWVAFMRKYIAHSRSWSPLTVQIKSSCILIPKVIQVLISDWQGCQCSKTSLSWNLSTWVQRKKVILFCCIAFLLQNEANHYKWKVNAFYFNFTTSLSI